MEDNDDLPPPSVQEEPRDLNSPRVSDEVLFSEREESGSDALVDESTDGSEDSTSTDFAGQQAEGSVPRSKPIDIPPRRRTMSTSVDGFSGER